MVYLINLQKQWKDEGIIGMVIYVCTYWKPNSALLSQDDWDSPLPCFVEMLPRFWASQTESATQYLPTPTWQERWSFHYKHDRASVSLSSQR